MKRIGESTARHTIAMMRSIARERPTSPFHLAAADEMEALLEEVLALREKLKEKENNDRPL